MTVLELGWGGHEDPDQGGASGKMWRDYFSNRRSKIVVIDNEKKNLNKNHEGVNFRLGSQDDEKFLNSVHEESGDFDLIVDDASHLSSLTIRSFEILWPKLKSGGLYVVEDTHMAYHSFYYGEDEASLSPDLPTSTGAPTMMQWFKRLADEANYRSDGVLFPVDYWRGYEVEWVWFAFNLCIVKKR